MDAIVNPDAPFADAVAVASPPVSRDDPWKDFRKPAADDPWKDFRKPAPTGDGKTSVARDIAKSAGSGLASGVEGVAATPNLITRIADAAAQWPGRHLFGMTDEDFARNEAAMKEAQSGSAIGSLHQFIEPGKRTGQLASAAKTGVDAVTGGIADYEPQTTAGRYVKSTAEMVPGVLLPGAGSIGQRVGAALGGGLGAQSASELLPEQFKGGALEGVARFVAAILGGGAASSLKSLGGTAEKIAAEGLKGTDPAEIVKAAGLLKDAADKGVKLTWPEAISQVQGAPNRLAEIQRMVEQSRGGSPVMKEFYADRPAQVAAAADREMTAVAPQTLDPVEGGTRMQQAATDAVQGVNDQINAATRPFYKAAEAQRLPAAQFAPISANPSFQAGLKELRSDPILGPEFKSLPDDSVGVIDQVTKRLEVMARKATAADNGVDRFKAAVIDSGATDARQAARAVSPEYDTALAMQAQGRKDFLEPMQSGPVGKLAGTTDSAAQANALFESAPQSGAPSVVGKAVRALVSKDPQAAVSTVGQHIRTVFAESTQKLQPGGNQWGGAKFAAQLMGNPEQAAVLEQAVKALPAGATRWDGWNSFMDVLEATGKRLHSGSPTEPNRMITEQLGKGGSIKGAAADLATGGFHLPARLREAYRYFQTGRNAEKLAKLFTDSSAAGLFGRLVRQQPGSPTANALTLRLTLIAAPELRKLLEKVTE